MRYIITAVIKIYKKWILWLTHDPKNATKFISTNATVLVYILGELRNDSTYEGTSMLPTPWETGWPMGQTRK